MGYINTTFLGKEYSIPQDVLSYIDLLIFTETMQKQLATSFVRMLNKKIQQGDTGLLGDEDLIPEIEQQVGKFIAKLCDNGIFTRTIRDYLDNNKGYQYVSDVNKAALEAIKSFLLDRLNSMQEGLEEAGQKADSRVTGMGFSIFSGSFINHAIYAAMEASTLSKQEKEADAVWRKETHELTSKLEAEYNKKCADYITSKYIPNMEAAFTVLAYELLDRYISDLIEHNKFDRSALSFVNIGRSNDLLKNLTLSENKKAILANAFTSCPYNIAVYMQAMKYDLLDYESFQTAKLFRHGSTIISFLEENLGGSPKSEKRQLNFKNAELLSLYSGRSLREITSYVADFIVDGYAQTIAALSDAAPCYAIMNNVEERAILAGDSISKQKAAWLVDPLAPTVLWDKLTCEYGHTDLFDRLLNLLPDNVNVGSKQEYDAYLKDKLFAVLESVRLELAEEIKERKREEQKQREIEAERARIAAAKRKKIIKYGVIIGSFVIVAIIAISLITSYFSTISNIEEYISDQQYEHAFDAVNSSNLSKKKKQEYRDVLIPLMQENISANIERFQVINADEYRVYLENNEIIVRDKNGEGLLYCNGGGTKILDEILYANGYIFFVKASDNWGYDVKYISIENGKEQHIETFDEFDRLIKLEDGRILIDSLNSNDMYVVFDPYKLTSKAIDPSSDYEQMNIVYDTNTYGYKKDDDNVSVPQDFSNCVVGDVIQLGRYEQDGNIRNGNEPIDWIVLKIQDGKAFLVSKYALDAQQYNRGYSQDTNWEDCWLRKWLNDDFLTTAFNSEELSIISGTQDKVLLLSVEEAEKHFLSDADRQCKLTEYAEEQGASSIDGYCWWWLQPAENVATIVGYKGDICDYGNYVHIDSDEYAVRPVMWIEIDEPDVTYDEYITWYNVDFASSFLGKELNVDGSLPMGPGDYEAMSNDMYLFDIPGRFMHGMSSTDADPVIVDILDWVTTKSVDNFNIILNPLIERYGDDYRVQHYEDAAGDAYMWKNVEMYEYVICWQNADGTVDIRWTYPVSSESQENTDPKDDTYNNPITHHTPGMFLDYQLGDPVLPDYVSKQTITIDEVNGHLYFESTDNTTVDSLYWVSANSNGNSPEIVETAHERIISYFENRYGLGKEVKVPSGVFPHYWGFDDETVTQFITETGLIYLVGPNSEYNIYVVQIEEPYK